MENALYTRCNKAIAAFETSFNRLKLTPELSQRGQLLIQRFKDDCPKPTSAENQHKVAFYFREFYQAFSRELLPGGIELSGQSQEDFRAIEELSNSPELIEALKQVRGPLSGGYF